MATKPEVVKLMTVMALAWPRYELPKQAFEVYFQILQDLPTDALEKASHHLMASSTFFPSISEWRTAAVDIMINKAGIPSEFEAWEEVVKELRLIGSYGKPRFSHPLIQRAVDTMGWRQLCASEKLDYDRAHFYKAYASLLNRATEDARMLPEIRRQVSGTKSLSALLPGGGDHG